MNRPGDTGAISMPVLKKMAPPLGVVRALATVMIAGPKAIPAGIKKLI